MFTQYRLKQENYDENPLTAVLLASSVVFSASAVTAANDDGSKDLNGYACKDIMRMSGDRRSAALAFLHGYNLGKKGQTAFDTDRLSQATDDFTEFCLDNPMANALTAR